MTSFMQIFKGEGMPLPPRATLTTTALAAVGGILAIAGITAMGDMLSIALVLGSFGASCVLVFAYPDVPLSQPRNIIAGHVLSSGLGLAVLSIFGPHGWAMALAVGLAIAVMMLTRTVHPPAGSNPVIVFLVQPAWSFLWYPTLAGALLLVAVAMVYNNLTRTTHYPKYW